MKANSTEKKNITLFSGSFFFVRLIFLVLVVPLSIPVACWALEALLWRHLLCSIDGISLTGGFLEAFALTVALAGFVACANLLLAAVITGVRGKKFALQRAAERKNIQVKSWGDIYRNLPGLRALAQHFAMTSLGLVTFTALQPLRLHFGGPFELALAAGVLSAGWIFCMSLFSTIFCICLLKHSRQVDGATAVAIDK